MEEKCRPPKSTFKWAPSGHPGTEMTKAEDRKLNLTDRKCASLQPSKGMTRTDYRDDNPNSWNLIFRVTQNAKSWAIRYRVGGKRKLKTLGSYPGVKLSKAREESIEIAGLVAKRIDPLEDEKSKFREAMTFGSVVDEYINDHCKKHQQ